ncbi:MAG TPA: RraA family protein [Reyranella sp.]|jgi:RraA family protein
MNIPELIEAFASCSVANIGDNLDRAIGAVGIRPFSKNSRLVGRALTVRTAPGDNLYIHRALEELFPGCIVVVDGGGFDGRALIGEIMAAIAKSRGAAGFVVDGAIRDAEPIATGDFPVFARSATHLGPYKNGPGAINVPVTVGGMIVNPGDIVVGDCDGLVAFSPDIATDLLEATRKQADKEAEMLRSVAEGTYVGAYS